MAHIAMYTAAGEAHGLVNTLTNSVVDNEFKHCAPHIKAKLEKERKEDAKIVKVEYINKKGKHERLEKPYCRYAGDPIQLYRLIPGYVYDLPYGFVKEVNGMKMVKRAGLVSQDGQDLQKGGAPIEKDQEDDWVHRLVPANAFGVS